MRIALLADIHGNLAALDAVLAHPDVINADTVWCLGDLVNYGPHPGAVIERVANLGWVVVSGNHDRAVAAPAPVAAHVDPTRDVALEAWAYSWTRAGLTVQQRQWLAALPSERRLEVAGRGQALLVHAAPGSSDAYLHAGAPAAMRREAVRQARPAAVVLFGHTHLAESFRCGGITFFNPGSVGFPKDGDPRASVGIVEWEPGDEPRWLWRRVPYDLAALRRDILDGGLPPRLADLMTETW